MGNGSGATEVPTWPPPRATAVDPYGMQTGSTASTAAGLLLTATGGSTSVASALGLGASVKMAAAGFSLATLGQGSLCAGLVLIGLGIVLNVASLVVRRQRLRDYENEYVAAKAAKERYEKEAERAKRSEEQPPSQRY